MRIRVLLLLAVGLGCSPSRPTAPPPLNVVTGADERKTPATVALDAAERAIGAKDYATAAKRIEEARRLAGAAGAEVGRAVRLETSLHAYRGDYEKAASVLVEHLKVTRLRKDEPTAFHEHNWLSILRQAQGDLLGALAEADARTRFGQEGTWSENERVTQTKLKETWHRAYLMRMYAQQVTGNRRESALAYAEEARQAYATLAHPLGEYEDSIAVLEAFFAMHDGDLPRARAAAKKVDIAKNDDVEDLYLVYSALDAAGDKPAAAAVRERIFGVTYVAFVVPVVRTWIEHDAEVPPRHWSPRNPTLR